MEIIGTIAFASFCAFSLLAFAMGFGRIIMRELAYQLVLKGALPEETFDPDASPITPGFKAVVLIAYISAAAFLAYMIAASFYGWAAPDAFRHLSALISGTAS